jgi:hypothetical protein
VGQLCIIALNLPVLSGKHFLTTSREEMSKGGHFQVLAYHTCLSVPSTSHSKSFLLKENQN